MSDEMALAPTGETEEERLNKMQEEDEKRYLLAQLNIEAADHMPWFSNKRPGFNGFDYDCIHRKEISVAAKDPYVVGSAYWSPAADLDDCREFTEAVFEAAQKHFSNLVYMLMRSGIGWKFSMVDHTRDTERTDDNYVVTRLPPPKDGWLHISARSDDPLVATCRVCIAVMKEVIKLDLTVAAKEANRVDLKWLASMNGHLLNAYQARWLNYLAVERGDSKWTLVTPHFQLFDFETKEEFLKLAAREKLPINKQ